MSSYHHIPQISTLLNLDFLPSKPTFDAMVILFEQQCKMEMILICTSNFMRQFGPLHLKMLRAGLDNQVTLFDLYK